ncbi:MAG: LPS assembly lipoprotein LptE [Methylotenera sp.]|nr:LPS assembly lipoprotein LptE [Methylotenera sp.]
MKNSGSIKKLFSYIALPSILSLLVASSLALSSCGFHLRGVAELSFKTVFVQGRTLSISRELHQSFKNNGIKVVDNIADAELLVEMINETNEKRILSLSGGGVVREFELNYRVNFRTREPANPLWSAPQSVQSRRDFSYNDNALLGKLDEEAKLNTDMRSDAVREIIRRLSAIKLMPK